MNVKEKMDRQILGKLKAEGVDIEKATEQEIRDVFEHVVSPRYCIERALHMKKLLTTTEVGT